MFRKKQENCYGIYPDCDRLNNAIRFIMNKNYEIAIEEIAYAIQNNKGYFHEDVKTYLKDNDLIDG